jgi:hypothetical protein
MHGRAKGRTGVAVLVALATSACSGGSASTSVTPTLAGARGGASATVGGNTQPDGTATSNGSATPGSASAPSAGSQTSGHDAVGAVEGYYGAVAGHNADLAQQFLSPEYLRGYGGGQAFAAWVNGFRSLTGLTLRAALTPSGDVPPQHPGYRGLTFVPVSYVARLQNPSANETDGQQDRFVLVGRSAANGKWLIVDIATSP